MDANRITCPYCWQSIDIEPIDLGTEVVELVTDCEVCCRPIRVTATWLPDSSTPSLSAEPEAD